MSKNVVQLNSKEYENFIQSIGDILNLGRKKSYKVVNDILVKTYWSIGRQIVEFEQKGFKKAEYGTGLLNKLSKDLIQKFRKGFSVDNLENMRKFYINYSISETSSRKSKQVMGLLENKQIFRLSWSHYVGLISITFRGVVNS